MKQASNHHAGDGVADERTYIVPRELRGRRLDDILECWMPEVRRAALRNLILDGFVRINGRRQERIRRVKEGDLVMLDRSVELDQLPRFHPKKTDLDARPEVLYEDESCLVLAKPAGIPAVPDRHGETSIHKHLAEWFGEEADLRIVHRLDKDTSGVLLLAKGVEAAREFDRQFTEREVQKTYLALIRGRPLQDEFECDAKIGKTISGGRVRIGDHKGGRESLTKFKVIERFRGFALLEAHPHTGRMHQIRAHLMWIRFPLAVDRQYGRGEHVYLSEIKRGYQRKRDEKPLIERQTLHALRLAFTSPASGERVEVEAAPPKDLALVLDKLRRYAAVRQGRQGGRAEERKRDRFQ